MTDGLEVREHPAEPALVDVRLRRTLGLFLHGLARRALGTDEQHRATVGDDSLDEVRRLRVHRLRFLEVDDVNLVTLTEDERGHLRVPEAGLMSEMDSRLQHLSHGHAGHEKLLCGLSLRASPMAIPGRLRRPGTPSHEVHDARVGCVAKKGRALYHEDPIGTMSYAPCGPLPETGRGPISW